MHPTPQQINEAIAGLRKEIKSLEEQYGTGVRPSWVGVEIGLLRARIGNFEKELPRAHLVHRQQDNPPRG